MIRSDIQAGIATIALDRPPANALNTAFTAAIREAHGQACAAGARVVILTGRPGMFSGGLDVPELLPQPRPAIEAFWLEFFRLSHALASSPVVMIEVDAAGRKLYRAHISGHAAERRTAAAQVLR